MIRRPPRSTLFPNTPLFRSGNARAVHHIESPAMTSLSRMSNVREIDGLIAVVSVIRPGAANEGKKLRSEEHTSELQSLRHLVCRLLLEKKKKIKDKGHSCIV